jgi:hypothetical protein
MVFQFVPMTPPVKNRTTLISDLTALGLTSNLKLVLDAGDSSSYTSGQSWLDRSGNGYDFFLGVDGSATASDPTFTGTVGGMSDSEYWLCDGGDYFKYDTTNEAWMQTLHKDGALFSFAAWMFAPAAGTLKVFGTNAGQNANIGLCSSLSVSGSTSALLHVSNGASEVGSLVKATGVSVASSWVFIGIAVDETAQTVRYRVNDVSGSQAIVYTGPSAASATYTMELLTEGNATDIVPSGTRMNSLAMWQGTALTADNLTTIYNTTRSKFGF